MEVYLWPKSSLCDYQTVCCPERETEADFLINKSKNQISLNTGSRFDEHEEEVQQPEAIGI